ncbi:ester cyclase [Aestuariibius insulae]|uniref:ester cyclase n=1 Tax=Aestuariibius insulae TaxID=2058287 RepID=UPI00345EBA74
MQSHSRNFRNGSAAALLFLLAIATPALSDDAATRALVERFYAAFNTQDVGALRSVLADDYVVHGTSPSLPEGDADTLGQAFQGFAAGVPDVTYEVLAIYIADDIATVRGTVSGIHEGPLFGIPASGARVEFGAIDVHRIDGGRIVESWHSEDFATMLRQIGALPAGN